MSLLVHLNPVLEQLKHLKQVLPHSVSLSTTQKVVVVSVTASVALLGVLARYMRRKKQTVDPKTFRRPLAKRSRASGVRSPNADLISTASSGRRSNAQSNFSERRARHDSILGIIANERASVASGSLASGTLIIPENGENTKLTPQQLGVMGMEALETCINYWEDALAVYRSSEGCGGGPLAVLGTEEAGFCRDLQHLLDSALELQESSEVLFLDERSVLFRPGSKDNQRGDEHGLDADLSGAESFASAQDQVADLREFEEFTELFPDLESLPLYQDALRQLENGGIPCRTLRTELVKCGTDGEYLSKLHCLRLAFQHMLKELANYNWFVDAGRQILADLLLYADKDPKDFLIGYEELLRYVQETSNWRDMEEELSSKGVKALTFYDVVLDYILMDAFEDLESPPSSVTAVVQNRWLSNGFKETALTTAVWSVLKAKRRMLRFPSGFMAHFYNISEQLSPLLAWGFLGPDESLKETCTFFKDQVMGFLADIFNFQKCKFTTVEDLSADVFELMKARVDNICQRLEVQV
ncbi:mitoguardin isoform X2 [Atheta coriaria]|uniref:mitoguardin isoform X2 n=1 Tax=Dalotia coriaria TaxID=877792 RepID=UPI0031F39D33